MKFLNTSGKEFTLEEVIQEMTGFIKEDDKYDYNVIIGTDSQVYGSRNNFVTVIMVHRIGKGGRFFYVKNNMIGKLTLYSRLIQETSFSIEIVKAIEESQLVFLAKNIEVHLDIGHNGKSGKFMKECVAYAKSMGVDCKVKPDGVCASHVADKYTR